MSVNMHALIQMIKIRVALILKLAVLIGDSDGTQVIHANKHVCLKNHKMRMVHAEMNARRVYLKQNSEMLKTKRLTGISAKKSVRLFREVVTTSAELRLA